MKIYKKLFLALLLLAILTPIGLWLPERLNGGAAWGEWSVDEIKTLAGYVPQGMEKLASLWNSPMPDYAMKGQDEASLPGLSVSYIISALLGIIVIFAIIFIIGKLLIRRDDTGSA